MAKSSTNPKYDALAAHAKKRDTIAFSEPVLHGRLRFGKGEIVKFPDPATAAYFDLAFNATEFSDKEPTRELTEPEINHHRRDDEGGDTGAEGETIIWDTIIGNGRNGINEGTLIHEAALDLKGGAAIEATLKVKDVSASSEG